MTFLEPSKLLSAAGTLNMNQTPESHSPTAPAMSDLKNTSQFVGFMIDEQQYAFRIEQIQEIVILTQVTRTPQVADHVEGVSNLRGSIIPIVNLRKLLGLEAKPSDGETRTIVVNVGERTIGCTVDAVSQVIKIPAESIQPAPEALSGDGSSEIAGFAKLKDQLVILLDVGELLSQEKLTGTGNAKPSRSQTESQV